MTDLVERVRRRLAERPDRAVDGGEETDTARIIREEAGVISDLQVLEVLRRLRHESTGAGPLEPLLAIEGVTDVVVNGPGDVWFDTGYGLRRAEDTFTSDAEVRSLATRLAALCGRRLDDAHPFADGRMRRADGTAVRVHALLSPPAEKGTCISLRVLRQASLGLDALVARGAVTAEIADLLRGVVRSRRSLLVVGGTGSGKTTLLAALLAEVSHRERIVCIEDTAELHPTHPHVVSLVARQANAEGVGEITMSVLLRQALRMRPDRIVVGEIRGAEVVDLLTALNTGHDGGAGTVHANSLTELPARFEALGALGGLDRTALHSQLTAAVRVVVSVRRSPDGGRCVHQIGILEGNPVKVTPVWDSGSGELDGFPAFRESVTT
ncbi:TadA family conjugal transfer-associated ATPase [Corynebacterium sp. CCM 8835]|uniref:TadA family conjugal transfer-associated ATPase n=1 Tax=Corynebacterium antarcticum TaxID=2800405 RepID=A0ABS1FL02_9CORY|nr:TadA family conjugal transfer-associated ATPase [Corynebacterium antarcticum]MCK7642496.1 TadA family conjugal transfer-associated ATPase [Corynebacterium antarcticum]MCK7660819.1 TadA family conjugal transfer-associated ATPase [Corynebacterium antarcticum]MCL0245566.1 TadA family conjugal transfer-associated ATPase [Corynebacterium antarcticum]MCX7540139.1 TadA family conjugal transfer-associated ATPase [Corynebacterium antarcticum]